MDICRSILACSQISFNDRQTIILLIFIKKIIVNAYIALQHMALSFEVYDTYNPHSKNKSGTLNLPILDKRTKAQWD